MNLSTITATGLSWRKRIIAVVVASLFSSLTFVSAGNIAHATSTVHVTCGAGTYDITYPTADVTTGGVVSNGQTCTGDLVIDPSATSIGAEAFRDGRGTFAHITSVYTGENVVTIGDKAFWYITTLETVTMGNRTTTIGIYAFYQDTNLILVSPGRSLTTIGSQAFFGSNFHAITFPTSLLATGIDADTFGPSTLRTGKVYHCGAFPYIGGHDSAYYRGLAQTQFCLNSISTDHVNTAGGDGLTLNGVGFEVGDTVIFGSENYNAVVDTVNGAGTIATVTTPVLPESSGEYVRVVHADGGWAELSTPAFQAHCFDYSGGIVDDGSLCVGSVAIPEGITSIGLEAFNGTSALVGITLPNSLRTIADGAFLGTRITSIVIPEGVTSIGESAFRSNPVLTAVTFPSTLETISATAFYNANLYTVTIPNSVVSIGDEAFHENADSAGVGHLTSVVIGSGLTEVGPGVFSRNNFLNSVTLGNHIRDIQDQAFQFTERLTSITLPNSVETVGVEAFDYSGLTSIILGNNVQTLKSRAFGNSNLTSILIPDSVSTIEPDLFGITKITSLTDVYYCYSPAALGYLSEADATADWSSLKTRNCPEGYKLSGISLSEGLLATEFSPTLNSYNVGVENRIESTEITWSTLMPDSAVEIRKGVSDTFTATTDTHTVFSSLSPGTNEFNIRVTSVDLSTVEVYTLHIYRGLPPSFAGPFQNLGVVDTTPNSFLAIASSSDGKKIISGVGGTGIRRSIDGGIHWTLTSAPVKFWYSLASSADGVNLVAASDAGELYYSQNSGTTWNLSTIAWGGAAQNTYGIAISANGQHVVLGTFHAIFFSDDAGATFSASRIHSIDGVDASVLPNNAYLVATSSDGLTILAAEWLHIYKSIDGGISWTTSTRVGAGAFEGFNGIWRSQSNDLALVAANGVGVFKSSDAGSTWTAIATTLLTGGAGATDYCGITASNDAMRILVNSCAGNLALSLDGGVSWQYSANAGGWIGLITTDGESLFLADFASPPSLYKGNYVPISVATGYSTGGTSVVISGTGFSSGTSVTFGGVTASLTAVSMTQITLLTPEHAVGTVDITITNTGGGTDTLTGAFTYITAPVDPVTPVVNSGSRSVYVAPVNVATDGAPIVAKITSEGGTLSALISNANGAPSQQVDIVIAPNTVTSVTTFALTPAPAGVNSATGFGVFRLGATASDGTSVTTFSTPLAITIPAGATGSSVAWSVDGFSWTTMTQLTSKVLPDGQADGYFINADGSYTLLTRHLTIFGFRKAQSLFTISSAAQSLQVGKSANIRFSGGSGNGDISFTSTTPESCSLTASGVITAVAVGTCTIVGAKSASGSHLDATSQLNVAISEATSKVTDSSASTDQVTPVTKPVIVKSPIFVIKSAKNLSSITINLTSKYAGKKISLEAYRSVKGKSKEVVLVTLALNAKGQASYSSKTLSLKGATLKLKYGSKYVASSQQQ